MEEAKLTHWKMLVSTEFIGAYSLQPGEERVVEIISVGRKKVKGNDGQEKECTVATLKNEKPFILNRTNCKTLTKLFATPFIENWKGARVTVFSETVKAFGETVDALRIRPTIPRLPDLNPTTPKWAGAFEAIKAGSVTIEAIEKSYSLTPANKKLLLTALIATA